MPRELACISIDMFNRYLIVPLALKTMQTLDTLHGRKYEDKDEKEKENRPENQDEKMCTKVQRPPQKPIHKVYVEVPNKLGTHPH